jgi:hypothetical protein
VIQLTGTAAISGNGVFTNLGSIYRFGGGLRSPSTCVIGTEFHNLAGAGIVQIEADTLALTNPVADNADTIMVFPTASFNTMATFTNLDGGVVLGGGHINVTINNLVIQKFSQFVVLNWTAIPGADHYDIYRATQPYDDISSYSLIGSSLDPSYAIFNGASLPRAFYRVVPR